MNPPRTRLRDEILDAVAKGGDAREVAAAVCADVRELLTELAETFDAEARDAADEGNKGDPFRALRAVQAEASATYVRCVRDTELPR